jgi:nucleoside-diphosphate-sugar epimerase
MRVFVTGATGFVGSAIVQELLKAGHEVLGLARSEASAAQLKAVGADVHYGSIYKLDSIRRGVEKADAVIHTAFNHDFSKFAENCETDRGVIEAIGDVLEGTVKPLIITSGTGILSLDHPVLETDMINAENTKTPRRASEEAAAAVAVRGVKVSVVRLPPSVHDAYDHGFVPLLINLAREKGEAACVGEGKNRWPAVHRLDAAILYRLILEHNGPSATYHAVAEQGIPFREIATIIGKRLNLPVVSKSEREAADYFGWFTHFASLDTPASSEWTRSVLGWEPTHRGLLQDVDSEAYFPAGQ